MHLPLTVGHLLPSLRVPPWGCPFRCRPRPRRHAVAPRSQRASTLGLSRRTARLLAGPRHGERRAPSPPHPRALAPTALRRQSVVTPPHQPHVRSQYPSLLYVQRSRVHTSPFTPAHAANICAVLLRRRMCSSQCAPPLNPSVPVVPCTVVLLRAAVAHVAALRKLLSSPCPLCSSPGGLYFCTCRRCPSPCCRGCCTCHLYAGRRAVPPPRRLRLQESS